MTLTVLDGPTIKLGESLSDGLDCSAGDIVRITVPQEYTSAPLTFQVSTDGNLYNDLHTAQGEEISIVAKPSTGIVVHETWARSVNFVKFRSGTRSEPVAQREDCKFAVAVETPAGATSARKAAPPQHAVEEPVPEVDPDGDDHRKGKKGRW